MKETKEQKTIRENPDTPVLENYEDLYKVNAQSNLMMARTLFAMMSITASVSQYLCVFLMSVSKFCISTMMHSQCGITVDEFRFSCCVLQNTSLLMLYFLPTCGIVWESSHSAGS